MRSTIFLSISPWPGLYLGLGPSLALILKILCIYTSSGNDLLHRTVMLKLNWKLEKCFCWLEREALSKYWTQCCFGVFLFKNGTQQVSEIMLIQIWYGAFVFLPNSKSQKCLVQELLILKEGLQIKLLKKSPIELNAKCKFLKNYI